MKKIITSVIVALGLCLSTFVTSAMAGKYAIGIIAATGNAETTGTETDSGGTSPNSGGTTRGSSHEHVDYVSIFAEYTFGEMYGMTVGASYTPMDKSLGVQTRTDTASDCKGCGGSDAGTYKAEADLSDHFTIYIEPTYMPSDNFGLYLKGGVSRANVGTFEDIALGDDSSVYGEESVYGGMIGLGTKIVHDSGLMFKFEYTKTIYQTVNLTSITGNKNTISADPEIEAVRLAIGWQF